MFRYQIVLAAACAIPQFALAQGDVNIRVINLPARSLAYDSVTQQLYASVSSDGTGGTANSLTAINPFTGVVGTSYSFGNAPGSLAVGPRGGVVYAVLDTPVGGQRAILPFDTTTATAGSPLLIPAPRDVTSIAVSPADSNLVAVATRTATGLSGVYAFSNGTQVGGPVFSSSSIAFADNGTRLYGYNAFTTDWTYTKYDVTPTGITVVGQPSAPLDTVAAIRYDTGRIFANTGRVFNAETGADLGRLDPDLGGTSSDVLADAARGRAIGRYYNDIWARQELDFYAINNDPNSLTVTTTGHYNFPSYTGVGNLTFYGDNGLALTAGNQIYLFELTPVPEPAGLLVVAVATGGLTHLLRRRRRRPDGLRTEPGSVSSRGLS